MLNYGTIKNTNSLYYIRFFYYYYFFIMLYLPKTDTLGFLHIFLKYALLFLDDNMDERSE